MDSPTKLAALLKAEEWSFTRIGLELGVTRIAVAGWVKGRDKTPRRRQAQLAIKLGIRVSDYFDTDGFARP